MAAKDLVQSQIDDILKLSCINTAEQMAVKVKCALWQVYYVCKQHGVKPLKPKEFRIRLSQPPSLIASKVRDAAANISEISAALKRPPALYSNSSPYGIANKLHQGQIF